MRVVNVGVKLRLGSSSKKRKKGTEKGVVRVVKNKWIAIQKDVKN